MYVFATLYMHTLGKKMDKCQLSLYLGCQIHKSEH